MHDSYHRYFIVVQTNKWDIKQLRLYRYLPYMLYRYKSIYRYSDVLIVLLVGRDVVVCAVQAEAAPAARVQVVVDF